METLRDFTGIHHAHGMSAVKKEARYCIAKVAGTMRLYAVYDTVEKRFVEKDWEATAKGEAQKRAKAMNAKEAA